MNDTSWLQPNTLCWVQLGTEDNNNYPDLFAKATITAPAGPANFNVLYQDKDIKFANTVALHQLFQTNQYGDRGYDDMVSMPVLNEPEILYNLKYRYYKDIISTSIGPTLIVMNPYKHQPDPLSSYMNPNYQQQPPHTYAIAATAYSQLMSQKKNQAIVISGESGAGKTENAKIAMKYLTCQSGQEKVSEQSIEDKIMACNPILESFGNAKTVRNDNSSRFGKYVKLLVSKKRIQGAMIVNYLLEKSRVVALGPYERNYHIFYMLLYGLPAEYQGKLFLSNVQASHFEYLKRGVYTVDSIDDKKWFKELVQSFSNVQITKEERTTIFKVLAAILYLGNLKFDPSTLTDQNPLSFLNSDTFKTIATLLDIPQYQLQRSLTIKTRKVGATLIESPLSEKDALSNKNALASNFYDRIFSWLVIRLNQTLQPDNDSDLSVGLLDIFGFENFLINSFEQFCINYTNEKLQQLYIQYVFKGEQQEFLDEGLGEYLTELSYEDNQAVISLMDKAPVGIFDLIDESSQLGSGTDDALYQKIIKTHQSHKNLVVPKMKKDKFSIVHTAKTVEYLIQGFRLKNKSEISSDLVSCVMASSNELAQQMFLVITDSAQKEKELERMSKPSKIDKFLGAKFKQQMNQLMDELQKSDCHFIRCLKPNEQKEPDNVVASYCLLQIKYLGVLESIRVRKEGYSYRKDYKVFYQQYHEIIAKYRSTEVFQQSGNLQKICKEIIDELVPKQQILYGLTKLFTKDQTGKLLNAELVKWQKFKVQCAVTISMAYKRFRFRKTVLSQLAELNRKIRGLYRFIALCKMKRQRKAYLRKKEAISKMKGVYWRQRRREHFQKWKDGAGQKEEVRLFDLTAFYLKKSMLSFASLIILRFSEFLSKASVINQLNQVVDVLRNSHQKKQPPAKVAVAAQIDEIDELELASPHQNQDSSRQKKQVGFSQVGSNSPEDKREAQRKIEDQIKSRKKSKLAFPNSEWKKQIENISHVKTQPPPKEERKYISTDRSKFQSIQKQQVLSTQSVGYIPKPNSELEPYFLQSAKIKASQSIDYNYPLDKIDSNFINKVQSCDFYEYCSLNFRKRKLPIEVFMQWSIALDKSLTHIPSTLELVNYECTKLVLNFDGSAKEACQIISLVQDEMIDEVYFLTIKQIINNPNALPYLQLLTALSSSVKPKGLFAIFNFMLRNQNEWTRFAFVRLMKTFTMERRYLPREGEIAQTFRGQKIPVPIRLFENNVCYVGVEPHFKEKEVILSLLREHRVFPNVQHLGITCGEKFVREGELIMDALEEGHLRLRIKLFFVFQPQDLDSICLYFMHFHKEYKDGKLGESDKLTQLLEASETMEGKIRFLEEVRKSELFMSWQFDCGYWTTGMDAKMRVVALKRSQLLVCECISRRVLLKYRLSDVAKWARLNDVVKIRTKDETEHNFRLEDSEEFLSLFKLYMGS